MKYAFQTAFVTLVLNVAASEGASFDRHNRTPFVGKRDSSIEDVSTSNLDDFDKAEEAVFNAVEKAEKAVIHAIQDEVETVFHPIPHHHSEPKLSADEDVIQKTSSSSFKAPPMTLTGFNHETSEMLFYSP